MSTEHITRPTLNLARKWRSRTFEEIIGQDVATSMLRNSLFKNHFFPVYLFAGQKGCGKTSSARIFAAAANCEQLSAFQSDPHVVIPCLTCPSCRALYQGTHPDFIEIDAASHTGIDDVRLLLDSCNFMPLLGHKKVYLIDEAHMLSKAAFNAFLKVLEEPPAQVIFMMATTEIHKIPETVRSRCFQLHFSAIAPTTLHKHLATVCTEEQIQYEPEALSLIIHETDGSARDALNLLEQVRFAGEKITATHVRKTLGIVSPHRFGELLITILQKDTPQLLVQLEALSFNTLNPTRIWQLMLGVLRTLIWRTYRVTPQETAYLLPEELEQKILSLSSQEKLQQFVQLLWDQEALFLNTPYKHTFLETLLIRLSNETATLILDRPPEVKKKLSTEPNRVKAPEAPSIATPPATQSAPNRPTAAPTASDNRWHTFCHEVMQAGDPILSSIFQQGMLHASSETELSFTLAHHNAFFLEKIHETKKVWKPLLNTHFGNAELRIVQNKTTQKPPIPTRPTIAPIPTPTAVSRAPQQNTEYSKNQAGSPYKKTTRKAAPTLPSGSPLLLTDENRDQWPIAHLLLQHFPGKLEIIGDL